MTNKVVFVTGGAGFIGSHCVLALIEAGYDIVAIDNFANSVADGEQAAALERVEELTGKKIAFYHTDMLDKDALDDVFKKHKIDVVIHFAAMKAIGESMKMPLMYYENNIMGTINLLKVAKAHNVRNFVFSGSCTVYGPPQTLPLTEEHPTGNVTNVYGRTKYFCEELLRDEARAESEWNIISLRYFNPVGAHPSGRIGEDPVRAIANIMPFLGQVATGKMPVFTVFGNDYDTRDGTCVRDYIHIMDLATGHVAAVKKLEQDHVNFRFINVGSGNDVTILELIKQFEESCNVKIPYSIKERREGDVGSAYGNIDRARDELGWTPQKSLDDMCTKLHTNTAFTRFSYQGRDFWRWKTMNPNGYKTESTEPAAN